MKLTGVQTLKLNIPLNAFFLVGHLFGLRIFRSVYVTYVKRNIGTINLQLLRNALIAEW